MANRVGACRGNVHGNGGERHDHIVEAAIAAAEKLLDHDGETSVREQVSLGLLQSSRLSEQPSGEDLRGGHPRPNV
jgi:hypothetical protein